VSPDPEWDAFVGEHPQASFFHLSAWKQVASGVFGHRAHYLTVRRAGALAAVLPLVQVRSRLFGHALISNAFCVGGGPLATDEDALAEILAEADRLGRRLGVDYVELRDTPRAGAGWTCHEGLYASFAKTIAASEDENLKQIPKKQRAVVRKALEGELTGTVDATPDDFFGVYARRMRDHGTPALPRGFFERLGEAFGSDCEVLTVRRDGRPISSVVSYYFRGAVMPYYTGSLPEARPAGANDLMYWTLMRRSVERGCTAFDFGRSKVGTGPYSFKCNWGFEPRPIIHQYRLLKRDDLPNLNPTNARYTRLIELWRRLPLPVANAISPMLSRSLG
jgi:FemAB-related protein (PEP-CTERM system-associated)